MLYVLCRLNTVTMLEVSALTVEEQFYSLRNSLIRFLEFGAKSDITVYAEYGANDTQPVILVDTRVSS